MDSKKTVLVSLMAGSAAGLVTDVSLFPLDTVKTRLQSEQGFWKSGGFRGVYRGLTSVALGSAPGGASFFVAYEMFKYCCRDTGMNKTPVFMMGAVVGEMFSCLFRVPFEVVKQRAQAFEHLNSRTAFIYTFQTEGIPGLYRGYMNTLLRDAPFSLLQFPLWEFFKTLMIDRNKEDKFANVGGNYDDYGELTGLQSAACGGLAGGIAAAVTTPLDVAKTRVMLAHHGSRTSKLNALQIVWIIGRDEGISGLFSGVLPRVLWISLGGAIFLGVYDQVNCLLSRRMVSGQPNS